MTVTGAQFASTAGRFIGHKYVYGAAGPNDFDCSGLVQYAAEANGLSDVARTSEAQWGVAQNKVIYRGDATSAGIRSLPVGTLIFSQWPGDDASPGHVAIYAGNNQLIEAANPTDGIHQIPITGDYLKAIVGTGVLPGIQVGGQPVAGTTDNVQGGAQDASLLGGLLSIPGDITQAFTDIDQAILFLINPMTWLRVILLIAGLPLLIVGVWMMAGQLKD